MRILVCPLDWGLGHASRCIPLIRSLIKNNHTVIIGASGGGRRLLEIEFPELEIFEFPGYRVRYSRSPAWFLPVMLIQLPALLLGYRRENALLSNILSERKIDLVISDGRYGVNSSVVPCVFITHQIFIKVPGQFPGVARVERLVLILNTFFLRRFLEVWIPDFPGPKNLSGDLSHLNTPLPNLVFIGILSRFGNESGGLTVENENSEKLLENFPSIDILAMVSGPEPQRGLFEKALVHGLKKRPGTHVLIRGLPGVSGSHNETSASIQAGCLNKFDHLHGSLLGPLIRQAKMVVARSGYTTVMELAALGVQSVLFVPTPGQSEQEYLAQHLEKTETAMQMDQKNFELTQMENKIQNYSGFGNWLSAAGSPLEKSSHSFSLIDFIRTHKLFQSGEIQL